MSMTQGESQTPEDVDDKTAEAIQAPAQQLQPQMQIDVDDTHVMASYSNFCRVTGSPDEMTIDFGLNPQPVGMPKNPFSSPNAVNTRPSACCTPYRYRSSVMKRCSACLRRIFRSGSSRKFGNEPRCGRDCQAVA